MQVRIFNHLLFQKRILWQLSKRANFWIVLTIDVAMLVTAHFAAYLVRFDFEISSELSKIYSFLPLIILIKIFIFYWCGLYRGMWRYTSVTDLLNIARGVVISSGILLLFILYLTRFNGMSRSVFLMDSVFTFLFISAHRGILRLLLDGHGRFAFLRSEKGLAHKKRLLLIGAGAAAEKVIREIKDNDSVPYIVVGLVDDDSNKQGLKIHGYPVLGRSGDLQEIAEVTVADELLIAISRATPEQMKNLAVNCQKTGIPYKVLPSIGEIIRGDLTVSSSRSVDYRDLLGRPSVELDLQAIINFIQDQTVLVTGAGGSIGSELSRQISKFNPKRLILIDASEENLYNIQMEFQHALNFHTCIPVLMNIQEGNMLEQIFKKYRPTVVFHAAAYKHVPLLESNPWEAVHNNIRGTECLINASIKYSVGRFVLVSSDKAVNPTNVMGATKRITELMMLEMYHDNTNTKFMAVRFGNVLGSSGSVVPLFMKQIENGGPVTVTDPEIMRYFMSIEEATQLILQAVSMGEGGEIFILDMGKPIKIVDLAKDLIVLMGFEPDKDIPITFCGLRPGEKLYEELITESEGVIRTKHYKIMVLRETSNTTRRDKSIFNELKQLYTEQERIDIIRKLKDLVPEYIPDFDSDSVLDRKSQKLLN